MKGGKGKRCGWPFPVAVPAPGGVLQPAIGGNFNQEDLNRSALSCILSPN